MDKGYNRKCFGEADDLFYKGTIVCKHNVKRRGSILALKFSMMIVIMLAEGLNAPVHYDVS